MFSHLTAMLVIVASTNYHICVELSDLLNDGTPIFSNLESSHVVANYSRDEDEAKVFLEELNKRMAELNNKNTIAQWNFHTNLTETNANISDKMQLEVV